MASIAKGILGPMRGKISNTVGIKRGNKNYLRMTGERTKPSTETQILQQHRFKETVQFMRRFLTALRDGFGSTGSKKSAFNLAIKANMQALQGDYPNLVWDYSQLVMSTGSQVNLSSSVEMGSTESKVLDLTWQDSATEDETSLVDDEVTFVLLSEEKGQVITKKNAAVRGDLSASILLPQALSGTTIHVWAFVVGATTKLVSDSEYAGSVTLA